MELRNIFLECGKGNFLKIVMIPSNSVKYLKYMSNQIYFCEMPGSALDSSDGRKNPRKL